MTKKADEELVNNYLDKEKRFSLLASLTWDIIRMHDDFDITKDENYARNAKDGITKDEYFARNAWKLEKISSMAMSYDALLRENPDYADTLRVVSRDKNETDGIHGNAG